MTEKLVIVGAGGFGRETTDIVQAMNGAAASPVWELIGVVDDSPSEQNLARLEASNIPYIGVLDCLADLSNVAVAIGVGSPHARATIATQIDDLGLETPDLVHPTAVLGSQFRSRGGLVACAHVSIGTNVALGRHVHLNPHAVIGHDTSLEDFVSVNPNATISGECTIGKQTLIGAGSVILQGLTVGNEVLIGASACVVKNAESKTTLIGVPATQRPRTDTFL